MMRRTSGTAPKTSKPFHLVRPLPSQFGLPDRFDEIAYLKAVKKRKDLHESLMWIAAWVATFIVLAYAWNIFLGRNEGRFSTNLWFYITPAFWSCAICIPIFRYFEKAYERIIGDSIEPSVRPYLDALTGYDDALRDWRDRQLETGQAYWREKRGIAFEIALRDFLVRRGCYVDTTKGSGDGGIDLIVKLGGSTYWCQCKGHATPVGVVVIREIAGVCSRGGGSPVVIAVNGYTSAAIATANQLGVLLIDTGQLITLAKQERISQWQ